MQATNSAAPVVVAPPAPPAPSPAAMLRAAKAQREVLGNQLEELEDKRHSLANQLEEAPAPTLKAGLEARIAEIDKRISDVDNQIAVADANVTKAAGVPNAVTIQPPAHYSEEPKGPVILSALFLVVCVLPLSIAYARRIWRRSAAAVSQLPSDLIARLDRLDHSVDSIAVEVERIGEGQRFVTRVMADPGRSVAAGDKVSVRETL